MLGILLGVHHVTYLLVPVIPSILVQFFAFRVPKDEEIMSKGLRFSMRIINNIYHGNNLSLNLVIYLSLASEASVCWIGFSHLNVFSAYLIRSWNRVMKFTGLCSLDLKYKWAKHSFCFTSCQIRVIFWAYFLFNFNELQLLRVTVKHTQLFCCFFFS